MDFEIQGRLPSLNEYISACRTNPYKGAQLKKEQQEIVAWEIMRARLDGYLKPVTKPCIINFEYSEKKFKRDLDNISGFAHKVILDALVETGILPDDKYKWVTGFTDSFYESEKEYIAVTIKECE